MNAAELLGQLLLQDVERSGGEVGLKTGVSKDRILSVHDPEMRHGHKSSSKRFDGHKAAVVVDTDSQLITAVDVLAGNAWDSAGALELVEQSEASTGVPVAEAMGDTAYGDGGTRQAFADAGLIAKVPGRPNRSHFPKEDFRIDLEAGTCTCPAGQVTGKMRKAERRTDLTGRNHKLFPVRRGGVWSVPAAGPMCRGGTGHRPDGAYTPKKPFCRRHAPSSRAKPLPSIDGDGSWWSTGWPGWSSWGSVSPATSVASRPGSSYTWRPRWRT